MTVRNLFSAKKRGASRQDVGRRASDHSTVHKGAPRLISNNAGPIKVWIVSATGFRQDTSRVTGLELLWRKLRKLACAEVCVITPERWDADAGAMADWIARNSAGIPRVVFVGYSYGVGNYFKGLASALQRHGISIDEAIFCDGIRRFKVAKFLSAQWFNAAFSIEVPANVGPVRAYFQMEDRLLWGHRVVAADPSLTLVTMIELEGYDHLSIDEAPAFHRAALTSAQRVIEEAGL